MASRQERKKEWQRTFILERAAALFADQGFAATTMEQVAEAAEFSKGGLYNYFESKEDLFISMLEHGLESMDGMLEEVLEGGGDFRAQLARFVADVLDFFETGKSVFRVLHTEGSNLALSSSRALGESMRTHFKRFIDKVARLVRRGQEQGVIDPGEDPRLVAMLLMGVLRGYMFYWILSEGGAPDPPHADEAVRYVERTLGIEVSGDVQGGEEAA
ncbi:MAG: TetR/AcrR family transcriptional regulator [bacterium]